MGDDVDGVEPLVLVECPAFHSVIVDAELFVRVTSGEVEDKVVTEGVVGVVELGEPGVGDVKLEGAWLDDEPEDEDSEADDDDEGDEELPEESEKAAAAASASAIAGVGLLDRGNGGTIVGAVQMGLLISHVIPFPWNVMTIKIEWENERCTDG